MAQKLGLKRGPLVGSFEENVLNNRLEPVRTVDGYTAEVRASGHFQPLPLKSNVKVSFFSAGDSFPYLGQIHIGKRGYRIPQKGTLQVTLFNPYGTLVKLFLLIYDLNDMPPNSQTFLRQRTIFVPGESGKCDIEQQQQSANCNRAHKIISAPLVRYLIQLNIVSSKSGRIYLNKDMRIYISKKMNLETASQLKEQHYKLELVEEMPKNPRYFAR